VRQELVGEHARVGVELDPVDGHRRRLGHHHAPDRVGHAQVGVLQLELDQLVGQFCNVINLTCVSRVYVCIVTWIRLT
jgi:hypothetical protein